jgi:poly-beta-1,6-N-acetyl-D-glucosamine synthase
LLHHRATGSAEGIWKGLVKDGRADYVCGYHPLFMVAKCVRRVVRKPWLVGSLGLFYGYVTGYLKRIPQVDPEVIAYLRRQQLGRIFGGKTIWK